METADNCDFFASPNSKKQANLRLPLNVQKLDLFQLQGGFAFSLMTRGQIFKTFLRHFPKIFLCQMI